MNLQKLALRKGMQVAGQNTQICMPYREPFFASQKDGKRNISIDRDSRSQLKAQRVKQHVKELSDKHQAKRQARAFDKDFFLSVLHSSATKREAKSYLQRFTPSKESTKSPKPPREASKQHKDGFNSSGVNLGRFYSPVAVERSPKFVQQPNVSRKQELSSQLHIALVKLRAPQQLSDATLNGVGRTLSQLGRLGLLSIVVVDCSGVDITVSQSTVQQYRQLERQQVERVVEAVELNGTHARIVDNIVSVGGHRKDRHVGIVFRDMLMKPLRKGIVPVIPSVGFTETSQVIEAIPSSEIVLALAKELTGVDGGRLPGMTTDIASQDGSSLQGEISLDRLIILDPLGGIPSSDRENGYHVFLNMEQEFENARRDLVLQPKVQPGMPADSLEESKISSVAKFDPVSRFAEAQLGISPESSNDTSQMASKTQKQANRHHIENLELARAVLAILPSSSSALLTSPEEAANSGKETPFQAAGVGTRRQKNPLIHNLLTDRPVFSSSLPVGRLGGTPHSKENFPSVHRVHPTTFVKHGMPVSILPDPSHLRWEPPIPGRKHFSLTDPAIDLPRLVYLIEDSFGRKLDVEDYLRRVNDRIAGVIIAGDYEGGAILTWELPPDVANDGSPTSRARMVPYLDKFAVLKKKQGSATADLVFKAMVRDCFPNGVCWRSRKDNVVNKWYFERSRGTWKLPGTGWTMFWTTPDLSMDRQTFLDYESVCKGIQPSWADNKAVLD